MDQRHSKQEDLWMDPAPFPRTLKHSVEKNDRSGEILLLIVSVILSLFED